MVQVVRVGIDACFAIRPNFFSPRRTVVGDEFPVFAVGTPKSAHEGLTSSVSALGVAVVATGDANHMVGVADN